MARIEATPKGLDVRYVVTSLKAGARHLYETVYCARGNAENFIKLHKSQLASDRTSCRDPKANQFRLILHTAAYWLLLADAQCRAKALAVRDAEFATLRLRLIKIAARVVEGAARIRVFLPTACPDRASSVPSPVGSAPQGLERRGAVAASELFVETSSQENQTRAAASSPPTRTHPPCAVRKNRAAVRAS